MWLYSSVSEPVAVLFEMNRWEKKSVRNISKKFTEVDMVFTIVNSILMASLPRAENAKYATGASIFRDLYM
jgi:hypothetical protein